MARTRKAPARPGAPANAALATKAGPRWARLAAAGLLLGLTLLAAGRRACREVRREAGLSVLLITVDTLRSDALGARSGDEPVTPWMDRLTAAGVRFTDAHAHNVVTLPSHANILSGRYPHEHGVRDNSGFRFPGTLDTLATLLKTRGYRTGAFVSAFPVASRFGLQRGFDVYEDGFADREGRPAFLIQERAGPETVALARRWLDDRPDQPSFCWVHLYEPHFPYDPPEPLRSRFAGDAYRGEVAAADAALVPLLEPILAAGNAGRTLVVLTADHGESLGEHGEATHGIFAYEPTLKVPLVLYQPRLLAPRSVSAPARHVDLLPTVLDALALPVPGDLPGRSLLPPATGRSLEPAATYFEALSGPLNRGWAPLHGVIRNGTKYIDLPAAELYDLAGDAREERNLAGSDTRRLDEMRALLGSFRAADGGSAPLQEDAATRQRLRSLGYLSAAAPPKARYSEQDDPKRLIGLDALLHDVTGLYVAGDLPGALARCRQLVERRPGMTVSLLQLAHLERESGNLAAAIEALGKAVAATPEDTTAVWLLGAYLTQAGKAGEAAALLEPYAARTEPELDILVARGLALAKLGRNAEAFAAMERARSLDPSSAMALVNLGTVQLMAGDRARARSSFEEALAMSPRLARAHTSLAMMAAEDGSAERALGHWKEAVRLDPRESEQLLALGSLLWQRGRRAEARAYLELFVASAPPSRARELERVRSWLLAGARG